MSFEFTAGSLFTFCVCFRLTACYMCLLQARCTFVCLLQTPCTSFVFSAGSQHIIWVHCNLTACRLSLLQAHCMLFYWTSRVYSWLTVHRCFSGDLLHVIWLCWRFTARRFILLQDDCTSLVYCRFTSYSFESSGDSLHIGLLQARCMSFYFTSCSLYVVRVYCRVSVILVYWRFTVHCLSLLQVHCFFLSTACSLYFVWVYCRFTAHFCFTAGSLHAL